MTDTLHAWLEQAWNDHADTPAQVAAGLTSRATALSDDGDGADAVRLAEHVWLAHLADPPGLRDWLAVAPRTPALQAARDRAQWALATIDDAPAPAIADAPRWRALHAVVMVEIARGQLARARERLLADEAAATSHADADARRAYAATANNVALDLRTGPRGDAARDALMLDAAALARRAWQAAGTWLHVERADYQLAMCHAMVGNGTQALDAAAACGARCEAEGADAAELFFAHECAVHAQRARMRELLAQITDAGLRDWCAATLART